MQLREFRSFASLDWRPPAGPLVVVGPNGAGKTTLLEAAYVAATTRSFRAGQLSNTIRTGSARAEVRAQITGDIAHELVVAVDAEGRTRTLDGKSTDLATHLAALPVLAWHPDEVELVAGGPEPRRRFLDRGLVHLRPLVVESLGRYRRALAEKRALLLRGDRRSLESWNQLLARYGVEIARGRDELARAIDARLGELARRHAPELPPVRLRYQPSHAAALVGEEELVQALDERLPDELARRQALLGPHRDRVALEWDGAEARLVASAGERKALGLLLVAALAGHLAAAGTAPALLLDDIDAELDRERLGRLASAFEAFPRRWLTSSRPEVWGAIPGLATVVLDGSSEAPREGSDGGS